MRHIDTQTNRVRGWFAGTVATAALIAFGIGGGKPATVATTVVGPATVDTAHAAHDSLLVDSVQTPPQPATPIAVEEPAGVHFATGEASYYGRGFAGRPTANGERFNPSEMTAAHRSLPFGTRLRVTNVRNGKAVVVRVNDRGPYAGDRILDLSQGAAERIGMITSGTAQVRIDVLS